MDHGGKFDAIVQLLRPQSKQKPIHLLRNRPILGWHKWHICQPNLAITKFACIPRVVPQNEFVNFEKKLKNGVVLCSKVKQVFA
jgi:hypothetical protein